MLTRKMIGGSYKFSDLLKGKKRTKNKRSSNKRSSNKRSSKGDPSKLGYHAKRTNLNIIMKGSDGNLYKNKRYKKTKRWAKVRAQAKVRAHAKVRAKIRSNKKKKK